MINKAHAGKFINEIIETCKKYDLSISHQDDQGAFIIEEYSETNIEWFEAADVEGEENGV